MKPEKPIGDFTRIDIYPWAHHFEIIQRNFSGTYLTLLIQSSQDKTIRMEKIIGMTPKRKKQ